MCKSLENIEKVVLKTVFELFFLGSLDCDKGAVPKTEHLKDLYSKKNTIKHISKTEKSQKNLIKNI